MKRTISLRSTMTVAWVVLFLLGPAAGGQPAQPPKDPKLEAAEKEIAKLRADLFKVKTDLIAKEKALLDVTRAEQTARKEAQAQKDLAQQAAAEAKAAAEKEATARLEAQKAAADAKAEAKAAAKKEAVARAAAEKARADAARVQDALRKEREAATTAKLAQARAALELAAARQALDAAKARTLRERRRIEEVEKELASARLQVARSQAELAAAQKKLKEESGSGRPASLQSRARIVVEVPSPEAALYVSGRLFFPTGGKVMREFLTPPLEPGRRYFYDLRVEMMRDGRPVVSNRRVVFRADTEQHVDFRQPPGGR